MRATKRRRLRVQRPRRLPQAAVDAPNAASSFPKSQSWWDPSSPRVWSSLHRVSCRALHSAQSRGPSLCGALSPLPATRLSLRDWRRDGRALQTVRARDQSSLTRCSPHSSRSFRRMQWQASRSSTTSSSSCTLGRPIHAHHTHNSSLCFRHGKTVTRRAFESRLNQITTGKMKGDDGRAKWCLKEEYLETATVSVSVSVAATSADSDCMQVEAAIPEPIGTAMAD
jgi:hypothetical protein